MINASLFCEFDEKKSGRPTQEQEGDLRWRYISHMEDKAAPTIYR